MDSCLLEVLEGRQELTNEKELEIIQTKVRDVLGPLGRLWSVMEEVKKAARKIQSNTSSNWPKRSYFCCVLSK